MKKLSMLFVVVVIFMTQLVAQKSTFVKGDKALNFGIGFGSTLFSGLGNKSIVPPISTSFELGIIDNILEKAVIGVGGYLGYASYKSEYLASSWKYSDIIIGGRGSFHYPLVDKLDTYSGIMMGFNISSERWTGVGAEPLTHSSSGGFVYSWFVGARYYLSKNFAGMAEVGYGVTYLNLGVALKF
jgi:hypothetical protein